MRYVQTIKRNLRYIHTFVPLKFHVKLPHYFYWPIQNFWLDFLGSLHIFSKVALFRRTILIVASEYFNIYITDSFVHCCNVMFLNAICVWCLFFKTNRKWCFQLFRTNIGFRYSHFQNNRALKKSRLIIYDLFHFSLTKNILKCSVFSPSHVIFNYFSMVNMTPTSFSRKVCFVMAGFEIFSSGIYYLRRLLLFTSKTPGMEWDEKDDSKYSFLWADWSFCSHVCWSSPNFLWTRKPVLWKLPVVSLFT